MELVFDSKVEREQYTISGDEVFRAERGVLLAYERPTSTMWKPKSAGRGAGHWEKMSGAMKPRAYGGLRTERTRERIVGDMIVLAGDTHVVIDDATLDASMTLNGDGISYDGPGEYVPRGEATLRHGQQTARGETTIDGEVVQMHSYQEWNIPLMQQTIGHKQVITVPRGMQASFARGGVLNGEIIIDGEVA